MPIHYEKDRRTGRTHLVVEKYWPHGSGRFRRRVANKTTAKDLWLKIETAVANGTWIELRRQLNEPPPQPVTVAEFAKVYLAEYCVDRKNNLGFKNFNLKPIERILGNLPVKDIRTKHGDLYVRELPKKR